MITDEAVAKLRALCNLKTNIVPVLAEEAVGRNKIPAAVAVVLAHKLNANWVSDVVQTIKVSRTGGDGWYRLANQPLFDGTVQPHTHYLLVDDTQTQGGTFAPLRGYIETNGGTVIGCYALTGKQYSVQLRLSQETLLELRSKYAELEPWFVQTFGYDFASLTQWEAKFILNSRKDVDEIRNRIVAARND